MSSVSTVVCVCVVVSAVQKVGLRKVKAVPHSLSLNVLNFVVCVCAGVLTYVRLVYYSVQTEWTWQINLCALHLLKEENADQFAVGDNSVKP